MTEQRPYHPNQVDDCSFERASIGRPQLTRAAIVQFGFLFAISLVMALANFQLELLEELEIPLSRFSIFVFETIRFWPVLAVGLAALTAFSLYWFANLDGKPVRFVRCWWIATISCWIFAIVTLSVGAFSPILHVVTGLTG